MSSINKVILVGNVGRDPEVRDFGDGQKVVRLSLATSERWKDKSGQRQERTEWHNVSIYGALADIAERYVTKGSRLYLEGKLQTRKYQAKDGSDRYATDIVLRGYGADMVMLSGQGRSDVAEPELDDAIPF